MAIECNDGFCVRDRAYTRVIRCPGELQDSFRRLAAVLTPPSDALDWVVLTDTVLPVDALHAWVTTSRAGAVVSFVGVVRDHASVGATWKTAGGELSLSYTRAFRETVRGSASIPAVPFGGGEADVHLSEHILGFAWGRAL